MTELKIINLKTETLIPYVNNARTHSEEQISQIMGSIQEFGFVNPILIDKDKVIIAGHGRLLAAQRLGLEEVPVICLAHLTESQRKALILADNRIAENAGWDEELLKIELQELDGLDFDLVLLGFNADELDKFLKDTSVYIPPDDSGETVSGSRSNFLAFGSKKIELTEDELAGLLAKYDEYTNEYGSSFGFASYLLDIKQDA